jgi:AcrR family transcriptional regulator
VGLIEGPFPSERSIGSSDVPSTEKTGFDRKLGEILSAAAQVFAERGYDRASIRMVAERARISVAGIYHYVKSKEELLFQIQHRVFHDLVEQYKTDSRARPDAAARLELLIRNHLERFLANLPELIVCSREIDRLEGTFLERVQAGQREYFKLAQGIFRELGERPGATRVDPRTAALAMFGTINWVHTWYRPSAETSAARMAGDFARIYLRGVLPAEESARRPVPATQPAGRTRPRAASRSAK